MTAAVVLCGCCLRWQRGGSKKGMMRNGGCVGGPLFVGLRLCDMRFQLSKGFGGYIYHYIRGLKGGLRT